MSLLRDSVRRDLSEWCGGRRNPQHLHTWCVQKSINRCGSTRSAKCEGHLISRCARKADQMNHFKAEGVT